jgi:hypothetical protein
MAADLGTGGDQFHSRMETVRQRLKHELQEWMVMFAYLWLMFGLFELYQSIVMSEQHLSFRFQGFAVVNALILSKVMLVAEGFHLAGGRQYSRPIVTTLFKSLVFALLFIVFHILESVIVGVASGKALGASVPTLAGGHLLGIVSLGVIMSVCLVPFFAFREVSHELGEGSLLRLLFERRRRVA